MHILPRQGTKGSICPGHSGGVLLIRPCKPFSSELHLSHFQMINSSPKSRHGSTVQPPIVFVLITINKVKITYDEPGGLNHIFQATQLSEEQTLV
jgi:hypothetical protein